VKPIFEISEFRIFVLAGRKRAEHRLCLPHRSNLPTATKLVFQAQLELLLGQLPIQFSAFGNGTWPYLLIFASSVGAHLRICGLSVLVQVAITAAVIGTNIQRALISFEFSELTALSLISLPAFLFSLMTL
jgi:hypothetical protein